ncbi:acyltransferase [Thermopolyspora sp. NPDC052614]|uniref:acyltransferase family protein n=1 Tax=Thermopolyspora sp. NPDC052614 TaxID=3155682 RepID=UPI0034242004
MPESPSTPTRLAWLDALRGVGATAVVAEHALPWLVPSLRPTWFNPGMYGVLVFFLVSGYIIPASLEQRGDVRTFWVSRVFRLYPLYLLVVAVVLVAAIWVPIRAEVARDVGSVASHLTMLVDVVNGAGVVDTIWTLSYEMVFYLLVTALFTAGLHRRSGPVAVAFGLVAVGTGLVVTAPLLSGAPVAVISAVVFAAGLTCLLTGRWRAPAAYALGLMALTLLLGSRVVWLGAAILAVMFAGTAIYRWERGAGPLWPVAAVAALVAVAPVWAPQAGWWWVRPDVWLPTIALAAATFAGAMALRRRRVPRPLVWLGLISYSLYLLHHPMLRWLVAIVGDVRALPPAAQLALAAGYLAVVLAVSRLTYGFVELPMQRLGRRLNRLPAQRGGKVEPGVRRPVPASVETVTR